MRIIEAVSITTELDPWFSLEALSEYSDMSVRKLRAYLTDPAHPLPHYRMKEPRRIKRMPRRAGQLHRKDGEPRKDSQGPTSVTVTGKILVRRSEFDRWMEAHRYTPDLDRLVEEVVAEFVR